MRPVHVHVVSQLMRLHDIRQLARLRRFWLGAMVLAMAGLAAAVTASTTVVALDAAASRAVHAQVLPRAVDWSFSISALGGTDFVLPATVLGVACLVALRHWHGALALAASVAATQAVVEVVKQLVSRPRPAANGTMAEAAGASFPSAHSATSMALYATLAFIAARECRGRARLAVALAGGTIVLAVGATRVYLGAHYPIDVVAGWLTGGALVLASWIAVRRLLPPRRLAAAGL